MTAPAFRPSLWPDWKRVDPRPWSKLNALWEHRGGWRAQHCGHPTAHRPWELFQPDGLSVLRKFRTLTEAFEYAQARTLIVLGTEEEILQRYRVARRLP